MSPAAVRPFRPCATRCAWRAGCWHCGAGCAQRVEPGDEVVTTPFTFAATLNAILRRGAVARFADIGDDFTLDPRHVEAVMTPRTRAVLPVDLYGLMCDMPALVAIAGRRSLAVVE